MIKKLSVGNDNVPRMFDWRVDGDRLILVLDWIPGLTLAEYLTKVESGKLPRPSPYEAVRLVRGLAHGLYHFHHKRQVIHGDINLRNLVVATPRQRLVTIDFGSAWFAPRAADRCDGDGAMRLYAAPELQNGERFVGFTADQFSASVVLFQLITLELPYDGLGGKAGRREYVQRTRDTYMAPSKLSRDEWRLPESVWAEIDEVVTTGLALDPDRRYATPRAWLNALDRAHLAMTPQSPLSSTEVMLTRWIGKVASYFGGRKGPKE